MTEQKYERICAWDVSMDFPEDIRANLRSRLESIAQGNPTDEAVIYLMQDYFCLSGGIQKVAGENATYQDAVKIAREKLAEMALDEQRVRCEFIGSIGGTEQMTPDPFVDVKTMAMGKPVDLYEQAKEEFEKMKQENAYLIRAQEAEEGVVCKRSSVLPQLFEALCTLKIAGFLQGRDFPELFDKINYFMDNAQVTMDLYNRTCRIDPTPEFLQYIREEQLR